MKRMLMFVGIGVAAIIVVVGISVGTVWLVKDRLLPAQPAAGAAGGPEVEVSEENLLPLKPFVTNLADTDRPKYISVTFELVVTKASYKESIEKNLPLVRDHVLAVLSSKKSQEVTGEAGANTLKNDVLARLNEKLGGKMIQKVLITDLVVQH